MNKKIILFYSLLSISFIGCKKSSEGNKSIIKPEVPETTIINENGKKIEKTSFIYKATDGTLVKVVFKNDKKENTISITSNKKTFILPKIQSTEAGALYQKDGMKAEVKGDSLILDQGNNIIQLVKTKI